MASEYSVTYDEYNRFCSALPATTHVVQWGNCQVWKVGGKVFAIGGWEKDGWEKGGWKKSGQPAFTFKTSDLNFEFLKEEPGYRPAPYMAARGMRWIQHYDSRQETDEQLEYYLAQSHRLVAQGLTKKKQKELGLTESEQQLCQEQKSRS